MSNLAILVVSFFGFGVALFGVVQQSYYFIKYRMFMALIFAIGAFLLLILNVSILLQSIKEML